MIQPHLIVMSGLPGSGKSTVAEGLAQTLAVPIFSIDPIEAAMWATGLPPDQTGIAAYKVAQAMAEENLKQGQTVIVDAVNPVEAARDMWRQTAGDLAVPLTFIEVCCGDTDLHRSRIENRVRNIPGMPEISSADVQTRQQEYEAWTEPRVVLDSAASDPEALIRQALHYLAQVPQSPA